MPKGIPKAGKKKPKAAKAKEPTFKPPFTEDRVPPQDTPVTTDLPMKKPEKTKAASVVWENTESQCVPKTRLTCAECGHGAEMHYGSDSDWCNVQRCRCQGWVN